MGNWGLKMEMSECDWGQSCKGKWGRNWPGWPLSPCCESQDIFPSRMAVMEMGSLSESSSLWASSGSRTVLGPRVESSAHCCQLFLFLAKKGILEVILHSVEVTI